MEGSSTTISPGDLDQTKKALTDLEQELSDFKAKINTWLTEITNSWDDDKVQKLQKEYKETYEGALNKLTDQIVNFNTHIAAVQQIYQDLSDSDYQ